MNKDFCSENTDSFLHKKRKQTPAFFITILFFFRLIFTANAWNSAPVLIHISDAIKPSKLISINGEGLDSAKVTIALYQDITNTSPATPPSGWVSAEVVQYDVKGNFVVVRFPDYLPVGIYNVWVKNSFGWSSPIKLNAPRALFISEKEAWAGLNIELVGRNLDGTEFGAGTNSVARLVDGNNNYVQTIVSLNPYNITFQITDETPVGTYSVEVSNDGGLHWSQPSSMQMLTISAKGRDDLGLGLAWANSFQYDTVYDVSLHGVPVNSGTDVTNKIQSIITQVKNAGGGVVYFPKGTYLISGLSIPSKVILKGEDMVSSKLLSTKNPNGVLIEAAADAKINGTIGLHNLYLGLGDTNDSLNFDFFWPNCDSSASKIFLKNVTIHYQPTISKSRQGNGRAVIIMAKERILISNCKFIGWNANCEMHCRYTQFKNNYVENSTGIMTESDGAYTFYESDTLQGHAPNNVAQNSGFSCRDFSYVANNYVNGIGSISNDGEGIMAEDSPPAAFNYGQVTGATLNSVSAVSDIGVTLVKPSNLYFGTLSVQIIDGTGLGQLRAVTTISGNTININKAWDVIPDTSSRWSLFTPNQAITWYKNKINHCGAGYVMYGLWTDGIVADNIAINSMGVSIHALSKDDNGYAAYSSDYFNRIIRNSITGVSWHVGYGAIGVNPARHNADGLFKGVQVYGTEIKENYLYGDPTIKADYGYTAANTSANIGLSDYAGTNFYGGYWTGSLVARDLLNSIIEDNSCNNSKVGIEVTRGNYGVVLCNNTFSSITDSNLFIIPEIPIETSCGSAITMANEKSLIEGELTLFPNPTTGKVNIKTETSAILNFKVTNGLGEIVHAEKCTTKSDCAVFDTENFPRGIYVVQLLTDNGNLTSLKLCKE